jgi:hypothetical protein
MKRTTVWIAAAGAAAAFLQLAGCGDSSDGTAPAAGGSAGQAGADAGLDVIADQASEPAAETGPEAALEAAPEPTPEAGPEPAPEAAAEAEVEAGPLWDVQVVEDAPNFKSRVAIAMDKNGIPHVAYNVATSTDGWQTPSVWYATLQSGVWKKKLVVDALGVSAEFPSIVVDASGTPYIFYNQLVTGQNQIDVFMLRGDGKGGFHPPENLTGTSLVDEWAATAAVGGDAAVNVLFQQRKDDPGKPGTALYGIGYVRVFGGALEPPVELATGTSQFSLHPDYAIAAGADGLVHAVYSKPGVNQLNNVLYHRLRASGWGTEKVLTETNLDAWGPAVAVDPAGTAHVVYTIGPDWNNKTLHYSQITSGVPSGAMKLTSSTYDRSYYLGLSAGVAGEIFVAFSRLVETDAGNNADLLFLHRKAGVLGPEERVTETVAADEGAPALALGAGGVPVIAFVENLSAAPNGKVYLARRAAAP